MLKMNFIPITKDNIMKLRRLSLLVLILCFSLSGLVAQQADGKKAPGVLTRDQAGAILPATVFFRGQSATIQARNSAGVRASDGKLVLAAMVDTSGYSSGIAQTYQAYLITELPLQIGAHKLAPGAYGFGFIEGNRMVVMDLGGNHLFEAPTTHDDKVSRPTPLQIIAEGPAYRLYLGRNFVSFSVAP